MARVARRIIEQRRIRILRYLERRAGQDGSASVSNGELAEAMGLTVQQVRAAMRGLAGQGMLSSRPQYLRNGAQAENAYRLTPCGRRLLRDSDAGRPAPREEAAPPRRT